MTIRPRAFYASATAAAVSVTLLSLTGVAALTGHLPDAAAGGATAQPTLAAQYLAPVQPPPTNSPATYAHGAPPPAAGAGAPALPAAIVAPRAPVWAKASDTTRRPAAECPNCGVVESVRVVEREGSGTGLGAVAGGVLGAIVGNQFGRGNGRAAMTVLGAGGGALVGNEVEKDSRRNTSYQVRVRLDGGGTRVLYEHERPEVGAGERVRIVDGHVVRAGSA
jgi:outer membrane lipoprotein SlyB